MAPWCCSQIGICEGLGLGTGTPKMSVVTWSCAAPPAVTVWVLSELFFPLLFNFSTGFLCRLSGGCRS